MQSISTNTHHPRRQRFGTCVLCERELSLSFHHLIPKKMHRRTYFRKHFTKEELARGINICRKCHDGIHKLYDEMTLAKSYSSLALLQKDEKLRAHFAWVAKQKVS